MTMKPEMLWIDLETTGLDARDEIPLELGLAVTDKLGNIIAENKWLIHDETPAFLIKCGVAAQDSFVGPMHEKSGLWDDLANRRQIGFASIIETDKQAVAWLEELEVPRLPLAGASIGSLDRPFVLEHFPALNGAMHYRNIDVSSIKELCKLHNPRVYSLMEDNTSKQERHRVLDDIHDSINEYLYYLDNFLFQAED
jgi:oligoribonuclease